MLFGDAKVTCDGMSFRSLRSINTDCHFSQQSKQPSRPEHRVLERSPLRTSILGGIPEFGEHLSQRHCIYKELSHVFLCVFDLVDLLYIPTRDGSVEIYAMYSFLVTKQNAVSLLFTLIPVA